MKQPTRPKHIPQRTCIVCGDKENKRTLIRLVRSATEGVVVDLTGKKNGRGAYVCHQPACWDKLIRGYILDKALKTTVTAAEKEALAAFRDTHLVKDNDSE